MKALYLLAPIEPRDADRWRNSAHVGVCAVEAASEGEARERAAAASSDIGDSPWLDPTLSLCRLADVASVGRFRQKSEVFYVPDLRLKPAKAIKAPDALRSDPGFAPRPGLGSYTMPATRTAEETERYVEERLGPDRGLLPGVAPRQLLEEAADVTVISYPKSGKTWIAFLTSGYVARYLGFGDLYRQLTEDEEGLTTFAPEARGPYVAEVARRRTGERWAPLVRFMHLDSLGYPYFALKSIPAPGTPRHLLLIRDPRDVLVSNFHHVMVKNKGVFDAHREKPTLAADLEIGEFVRSEHFGVRHILAYLRGWTRWAEENGAPIFYFEDFVADIRGTLRRFLLAAGVSAVADEHLDDAIAAASFRRLSGAERLSHERRGTDAPQSALRMRRGKVGGYADEVTADDADYMTRLMVKADLPALRRYLPPAAAARASAAG